MRVFLLIFIYKSIEKYKNSNIIKNENILGLNKFQLKKISPCIF